jgi:hypothetical protein
MSTNIFLHIEEEEENFNSKLSLVIRKPQEGKTFICISNITSDKTRNIHIVLTMNTLASGMQFFGRMEEHIGSSRIIAFNSKKSTAGNCLHAKNVIEIFELLRKHRDVKVLVCCAHEKRIRDSIPQVLNSAVDSVSFMKERRQFVIHIDEAHKYIPENREYVRKFNATSVVSSIIGYSGSPDKIWSKKTDDQLFHKIQITDVEKELNLIRCPDYFGVKNCNFHIYDDIPTEEIIRASGVDATIPDVVFERSKMTTRNNRNWYGSKFYFDLGNEMLYLSFIKFILPQLQVAHNQFSYHFIPAYTRLATHYQTVDLLLEQYPTANVIVINGNGTELYRARATTNTSMWITNDIQVTQEATEEEKKKLLEPSYLIQKMIESTFNCPTFVTGLTCVGMSVTLINEKLGNFDNVIMAHQHFGDDKLYQLCRFLFNFMNWSAEGKGRIRKTNFHSLSKSVVDTCLQYEEHVERLSTDFAGKLCTLREIDGLEPDEPTGREKMREVLSSIRLMNPNNVWKPFKVYDGNDEEMWAKAQDFYKTIRGKFISKKSMPEKKGDGFFYCSTTGQVNKQRNDAIKNMASQSWWSTFQLLPNRTEYARVFVGYDSLDDNTEYTIYIKNVKLEKTPHTLGALVKALEYGKKTKKSVDSSSQETDSGEEE